MRKTFLVGIVLFFGISSTLHAGWKFITPMPHGRYCHDAVLGSGGKIYVMGGVVFDVTERGIGRKYNDGRYSTLVYDPCQDKWAYKEIVPGNILSSGQFLIFDEAKGEWKYKKKKSIFDKEEMKFWYMLPDEYQDCLGRIRYTGINRQGAGVALVTNLDGLIWWIGGRNFIGPADDLILIYDPLADRWTDVVEKKIKAGFGHIYKSGYHLDIPRMHEQRCYHEAVMTSDGKIFVLGGGTIENVWEDGKCKDIKVVYSKTMECYDPKTNEWEYRAPFRMTILNGTAIVGADDKIYVFGGASGERNEMLDIVEVYDPKEDKWASRRPMPEPRASHTGVLGKDGRMYILGGQETEHGSPLKDVLIYDPKKDTWERGPNMMCARAGLAAVSTPDGKIYAIGGTDLGAHETRETINYFLPKDIEIYQGKVQDTVEVLDISEL